MATAQTVIQAPIRNVWDALVNPPVVKECTFGAEVLSDWKKGSAIVWKGVWKGRPYEDKGAVLELNEGERVSYSHFRPSTGAPDLPENYHTVTIELEIQGEQTVMTLTQGNNPNEEAREHSQKNWETMLQSLNRLLES